MSYYNLCVVIVPPVEVRLHSQWRYDCIPNGGRVVLPVEVRLHSQWEDDCIPNGKTIVFLLGRRLYSYWRYDLVLLFVSENGERDMIPHGKEANEANDKECGDGRQADVQPRQREKPIDQPACHAGHGIDVFPEDDRLLVQEYIADNATGRSRDAPHDDSHPKGMFIQQCLLQAGYREEGQSEGIEHEPCVLHAVERLCKQNDNQQGEDCADDIDARGHPKGSGAEHHVANRSATYCNRETADKAAEPIEMLGCGHAYAGYSKSKGADEFDQLLDGVDNFWIGINHRLPFMRSRHSAGDRR